MKDDNILTGLGLILGVLVFIAFQLDSIDHSLRHLAEASNVGASK